MDRKRKFSVGAWVFTITLVLVLSGIIAGFYYKNLPLDASLPYFGAVAFLSMVSIWLTKYHDEPGEPFTKASFIWKCVLMFMMAINAAFCFHLGRHMGVARSQMAAEVDRDKEFRASLAKQAETAGPRGKLELAKMLREYEAKNPVDLGREAAAFKDLETPAFWIMIAEFLTGAACVLCMMGLMIFGHKEPDQPSNKVQRKNSDDDHDLNANGEWARESYDQRIPFRGREYGPVLKDGRSKEEFERDQADFERLIQEERPMNIQPALKRRSERSH